MDSERAHEIAATAEALRGAQAALDWITSTIQFREGTSGHKTPLVSVSVQANYGGGAPGAIQGTAAIQRALQFLVPEALDLALKSSRAAIEEQRKKLASLIMAGGEP